VAETMTCRCGQTLDIKGFAPGQQVRCPRCNEVQAVGGAGPTEPPVAMAVAIDDDSSAQAAPASGPAPAGPQRKLDPQARRKMVDRKADYAAQAKFRKIMLWPSLILGLLSLGVAAMGFYYQYLAPKTIEVENDADGIPHYWAKVLKEGSTSEYERIEVKPDLQPGDKVVYDSEENPVITLRGRTAEEMYKQNVWRVPIETTVDGKPTEIIVPVERRGWWFYKKVEPVDAKDSKPRLVKEDVPVVAQIRGGREDMRYVPVTVKGTDFFDARTGRPVDLAYYKAEEQFATNPLGQFKISAPPLSIPPWVFIWTGIPIGLFLLAMGSFFGYEVYFSGAAKPRTEGGQAPRAGTA